MVTSIVCYHISSTTATHFRGALERKTSPNNFATTPLDALVEHTHTQRRLLKPRVCSPLSNTPDRACDTPPSLFVLIGGNHRGEMDSLTLGSTLRRALVPLCVATCAHGGPFRSDLAARCFEGTMLSRTSQSRSTWTAQGQNKETCTGPDSSLNMYGGDLVRQPRQRWTDFLWRYPLWALLKIRTRIFSHLSSHVT